jgi:hypothetical protein
MLKLGGDLSQLPQVSYKGLVRKEATGKALSYNTLFI